MRSVLLLAMFLLPFSSSSPTHGSSDPLLDHKLGASPHEHLNGFNSLKAAAADVEKLGRGHGGTAGSGGDNNNVGGGNVPAGGAVVPVIIAGAANNNQHRNTKRGAATRNISNINIYCRGLVSLVTTATLASLQQLYMFA